MESTKSFDSINKAVIMPEIEKLEVDRKKYKKRVFIFLFLIHAVFFALVYYFENFVVPSADPSIYFMYFIIYVILLTVFLVFLSKSKAKLGKRFKEEIIVNLSKSDDWSLKYDPKGKFPQAQYLVTEIYRTNVDYYTAEDLVIGKIGQTPIRFAQVHSEKKNENRKNNDQDSKFTIFQGVIFEANFKFKFNSKIFILNTYLDNAYVFGIELMKKVLQNLNEDRPSFVKANDPEFEKYFAVYSENEQEAKNILTDSFMKSLIAFMENRNMPIGLSFIDNKVFITIRDHMQILDPSIFYPNKNQKMVENYFKMLELFKGVVNDLTLNKEIWADSKSNSDKI